MNNCNIREAKREDTSVILDFIKQLADYERMSNEVVADETTLESWIFDKSKANVLICSDKDGNDVGFALYFYNFSTFLGKAGIYLEDLFINPSFRGKGYGKALISALAKKANDENCGRLEWSCLDWNKPSIDFYLSLGAVPMDGWTGYRLTGENLENFK